MSDNPVHSVFLLRLLFLCSFTNFFGAIAYGQQKTNHHQDYDTIVVKEKRVQNLQKIEREDFLKTVPHDLGHLLQQRAGIHIHDYGGVGGMKTLSFRGLGAQHNQLIVNGQSIQNAQNGQTDFGLIHLDNIESVQIGNIDGDLLEIPASAIVMGNTVQINTFESSFGHQTHEFRGQSNVGSFGQVDVSSAYKMTKDRYFSGVTLKRRSFEGAYPFAIRMGNESMEKVRKNNALTEYLLAAGSGLRWRNDRTTHQIKFFGQYSDSDKELPGAVILYNSNNNQTLLQQNGQLGVNYIGKTTDIKWRIFGNYQNQFLRYHDPSFLNQAGYLLNEYQNDNWQLGGNGAWETPIGKFSFAGEFRKQFLSTNRADIGAPIRYSNDYVIQYTNAWKNWQLRTAAATQIYSDENRSISHTEDVFRINPQISLQKSLAADASTFIGLHYKQTMRLPNFNELYYSQIGNTALLPEDAHQLSLELAWHKKVNQTSFSLQPNIYFNQIQNKIIALPTQNLFVWSIMNVENVHVYGADLQYELAHQMEKLLISASGSLTYQRAIDYTMQNSPSFGHQLAYTPMWTTNHTIHLNYQKLDFYTQLHYVGQRYSLNQNVPANLVAAYFLTDFSMAYNTKVNQHQLRLQVGVRNAFDQSYNFIRFFVMPGRNYFAQLNYTWHNKNTKQHEGL